MHSPYLASNTSLELLTRPDSEFKKLVTIKKLNNSRVTGNILSARHITCVIQKRHILPVKYNVM